MQLPVDAGSERYLSGGFGPRPDCTLAAVFYRTDAAQSGPRIVHGGVSAGRPRCATPAQENDAKASRAEPIRAVCRGVSGLETLTLAGQPRVPNLDVVIS